MQQPPHGSILLGGAQARGQIPRIELHHVPRKDNDATNFLTKLAARRVLSLDGVFINDLPEPYAHILEGLIQTHPDAKLAPRGSNPSASMTTSPADVVVLALNQTDWQAPLLAYLLEEVLPPERTKAR